jgi:hypothetical protein
VTASMNARRIVRAQGTRVAIGAHKSDCGLYLRIIWEYIAHVYSYKLEVCRTRNLGWAVRTLEDIKFGAYIIEYDLIKLELIIFVVVT